MLLLALLSTSPLAFSVRPALTPLRSTRTSTASMGVVEVDETWTTTDSGLMYKDVVVGSGEAPEEGAIVKVEYTGWLQASGKKFDSSVGRAPIAFSVGKGRVIPGWDEGILTMKVGGNRLLSIPANLGYGATGAGDAIPPDSELQFDCKLVSIESGVGGAIATFPGGLPNVILVSILLLSFVPYFLPPDLVPSAWLPGGGDVAAVSDAFPSS